MLYLPRTLTQLDRRTQRTVAIAAQELQREDSSNDFYQNNGLAEQTNEEHGDPYELHHISDDKRPEIAVLEIAIGSKHFAIWDEHQQERKEDDHEHFVQEEC